MFKFTSLSAIALMASIAPVAVQAEPTDAAAAVDTLIVTGSSLEETLPLELSRYGSSLEIIDSATLRNNAYIDLSQALQMQTPGLHVAPRNGPFSYVDLSLQGSRTGDVLWLVDGVRINNRLYTSTSPADTLPASMIERVEVLKGGQSLFYGTQAAAGVINVVTRGFSDTPDGSITVGGDTNKGVHANAYGRGAIGGHKLVAWISKDEAEGYETFDAFQPSATARKRGYDVVSAGVKYGYALARDLQLNLQAQHTDAHLDYPGARLTKLSFNDRDEDILSARLDYTPSQTAQLFLKGYYHDWDSVYTTINNVPGQPGQTVTLDDLTYWGYEDYGFSAVGKFRLNRGFEYQLGYDFQNFSGRDDVLLISAKAEQVHALSAQVRTTEDLLTNGRFAAGFRYNRTDGAEATVWNVSGHYALTDTLYMDGVAGTSFILPSAEQLFAVDPCCAVGNRDLGPETSLNLNLALGGRHDRLTWQVTGFARKIDDLIVDDYSQAAFPDGIFVNTDEAVKVRGAEVLVTAALTPSLRTQVAYTYTRSRADGSGRQLDRTPQHFAKASLTWDPASRPYGASASANWTGAVYSTVTGFGRQNYGDYVVVDLAAHLFLDSATRHHRVGMRLENAFDETYATRVSSGLVDQSTRRFLFHNRGVPRTLHLNYTYDF